MNAVQETDERLEERSQEHALDELYAAVEVLRREGGPLVWNTEDEIAQALRDLAEWYDPVQTLAPTLEGEYLP